MGIAAAGKHQLYARWTAASNRNATSTFTVHHDGGSTAIVRNQLINGGEWVYLGLFDLTPGQNHRVVLTDTGSGYTVADALLVEPIEACPRPDRGSKISWSTVGWSGQVAGSAGSCSPSR